MSDPTLTSYRIATGQKVSLLHGGFLDSNLARGLYMDCGSTCLDGRVSGCVQSHL